MGKTQFVLPTLAIIFLFSVLFIVIGIEGVFFSSATRALLVGIGGIVVIIIILKILSGR